MEALEVEVNTLETPATRCVLVVDDELVIRTLMADILATEDYQVMLAADGQECLGLFALHGGSIDLVVLDLTMPTLDGVETFHRLVALDPEVRVLLASGYSRSEVIDRFPGRAPDGFIQKPFRVETILARVREALAD